MMERLIFFILDLWYGPRRWLFAFRLKLMTPQQKIDFAHKYFANKASWVASYPGFTEAERAELMDIIYEVLNR